MTMMLVYLSGHCQPFPSIRTARRHDTLFIGLENRVWRWEPRGAAEILKVVMPMCDSGAVVSLTLLSHGIPATTLIVSRKQYDLLLAGRLTAAAFSDSVAALLSSRGYRSSLGRLRPANPSFNKLDVVVVPQLKFQFGNYVHPLEFQFNIAPAVQSPSCRGSLLPAR